MGLLQNIFGEYTGDPGFIPEDGSDFDTEIKIEQQAGEPDKRTVIRRPQTQPDLPDMGQSFNPMELWQNVSKVVDAEMMTQEESNQKAQQIGEMAGGWPDVQVDTGVPTTPPMPPGGPIPHIMGNVPPQGQRPGQPTTDPTAGMPYPPSVFPTSDMPGNPHELGGRPPWNQGNPYLPMEFGQVGVPQGTPPGQPMADPTAGYAGPNADMSQPAITPPPFGAAGGMEEVMTPQVEGFPEGAKFTPEEISQRQKSGDTEENIKKTEASIATAANEGTLANTVSGQDASTDPMMWEQWGNLAQNPVGRKADYLKRMNMLILGGIMLDAMAAAMGVQSEAGRYIEAQLKMMEAEQKFDDQQRIYDLGRAAYYNEAGEYTPPGSQQEVFDRLMQSGATISEASAMAGKHPKGAAVKGYKEYWSLKDGSNIFLPTTSAPPPGYTAKRPSGAPGSDPATDPRTAAMKDEQYAYDMARQIEMLRAEGKHAEADALSARLSNFKNRTSMARNQNSKPLTLFKELFGKRIGDGQFVTDRPYQDLQGNDINWPDFYEMWNNQWEVQVMDEGKPVTVPGARKLQTTNPTQSIGQATQSEVTAPGQRSTEERLAVAQSELKESIASGKWSTEALIDNFLAAGWSREDLPEEYR